MQWSQPQVFTGSWCRESSSGQIHSCLLPLLKEPLIKRSIPKTSNSNAIWVIFGWDIVKRRSLILALNNLLYFIVFWTPRKRNSYKLLREILWCAFKSLSLIDWKSQWTNMKASYVPEAFLESWLMCFQPLAILSCRWLITRIRFYL